ncbi:MAG: peptidoglycan editing factor PgeF [Oscillospiraceae bacterium]|nr:peptidoglycan editing factor PgeF [Oscillospiraceae bacterium]
MTSRGAGLAEIRAGALSYMAAPGIAAVHAFTTRYGGVSRGVYASLNLRRNGGDERSRVRENYGVICSALGIDPESLVFTNQVHGSSVRRVGRGDARALFDAPAYDADGLITAQSGVALAVFTADCTPILLYDPVRGAIGAVHAGWRGTAANIAGAAAAAMERELGCSPADIRAAIGPCISQCCFETDSDVADAMCTLFPHGGAERGGIVKRLGGKFRVDIKAANAALLARAGLRPENISVSDECTRCLHGKYWSHRAMGDTRGSQAAIIAL